MVPAMRFPARVNGAGMKHGRPTGAEGGSAGCGDRFFEGVLAENRRAADAAGTDWKTATCRHIQNQIEKGSQMTVLRMCESGSVSRAGLYRYDPEAGTPGRRSGSAGRDPAHRPGVPYYGRPRITAELKRADGRSTINAWAASCGRTICFACGGGSSWSPPIPITASGCTRIWPGAWN